MSEGALLIDPEVIADRNDARRDDRGHIRVADRNTGAGKRAAIGVSVGALSGMIARPVGVAAGGAGAAALTIGAGTAAGVVAGGAIGLPADAVTEGHRETVAFKSFFTMKHGQSVLVAEISDDWVETLDNAMRPLDGVIYGRANTAATNAVFGDRSCGDYPYLYHDEPMYD